ncbi:hypothetical protein BDV36DRAFT_288077 [Aspergillus pseudocaelatus]|uniref:Uncharacterized protein n=1 Tax=Aspergillus pseudocaelatus TaxID=1825620 RepID=A0ABQ6W4Z8_9EURO|nr:hypothetical protein BDV36DRAFT_288077 [Aspergillus pseudocaelatus]
MGLAVGEANKAMPWRRYINLWTTLQNKQFCNIDHRAYFGWAGQGLIKDHICILGRLAILGLVHCSKSSKYKKPHGPSK